MADNKPKLLLFLSVDVIGSTAFKNSFDSSTGIQPWLGFFWDFYLNFPSRFNQACETLQGSRLRKKFPPPKIWKSLGDELIFYCELSHSELASSYVKAFRKAVLNYRNEIKENKELPLSLKATAWTAGFPVINSEIKSENLKNKTDYLGPHIDIGFRLSKYSDNRKFVISAELALLISAYTSELKFYFDGRIDLKGINLSSGYPLVWIDMYENNDYRKNEDDFLQKKDVNNEKLESYLREFLKKAGDPFFIPFIRSEKEDKFNIEPKNYNEKLEAVKDLYEKLEDKNQEDGKSDNATTIDNKLNKLKLK